MRQKIYFVYKLGEIMGSLSVAHLVILALVVLMLAPVCMWCVSYKKLLARFDKKNQRFSPNLAFLLLVPVVGLFWWGYLAFYVKSNLNIINNKKVFENYEDGGFILTMMSIASSLIAVVAPSFHIVFAGAAFILWIFSWIKIVKTRKLFRIYV